MSKPGNKFYISKIKIIKCKGHAAKICTHTECCLVFCSNASAKLPLISLMSKQVGLGAQDEARVCSPLKKSP